MIVPSHAIVKPRAICPETGESLPLEQLVEEFVALHDTGAIEIVGGPGAGKTTALKLLAETFSPGKAILYLDDASLKDVAAAKRVRLVVYTRMKTAPRFADVTYEMASWGADEWIEYLLATRPAQCQSVMARLHGNTDGRFLVGNPELWRIVLDRMAGDASVRDVRGLLRAELDEMLPDAASLRLAEEFALAELRGMPTLALTQRTELAKRAVAGRGLRVLRHRVVQTVLATARLQGALEAGNPAPFVHFPRELIREVARVVLDSPSAAKTLHTMLTGGDDERQSTAASILHAMGKGWKPATVPLPSLERAQLAGAKWPGITLLGARLNHANLAGADLTGAVLSGAMAVGCRLERADLRHASLSAAALCHANLCAADLANAAMYQVD